MKKRNVFLLFLLSVFVLSAGISLSGCGGASNSSSPATLTGTVKGGFTSITPTSVAVYGCTEMDFSNCKQVGTTVPTSSSFTITYDAASVDTSYFVEATVGDVELEAVVPPNIPSGGITVNEYTTLLTQEAYYYAQKTNAANAGLTTANILSLEDPSYDGMPNTSVNNYPESSVTLNEGVSNIDLWNIEPYLVVMADDIAACIDASASPYTSLAATSACTTLESDVNTGIGTATSAPTTVQGILSNIASTLTTYYGSPSNTAYKSALETMQGNLYSLLPSSPDFTYSFLPSSTFPNSTAFSPSTVPQPPIASSVPNSSVLGGFSITAGEPPSGSPNGLVLMYDAGCLNCHTITTNINSIPYTLGPGAPFNNPSSPYYVAPDLSYVANYLNFLGIGIAVDVMTSLPTAGVQDTINPVPVFNGTQQTGIELGEPLTLSEIETIDGYLETLSVGSGNYVAINYSMSSGGTVTASAPQKVSGCPSGYTAVTSYESSTATPLSSTSNGKVCVDESDAVPVLNTAGCLNCHTLFDTQGEPFYHTNATGFHIFPSGAVGPDLSDIGTFVKSYYIDTGLGGYSDLMADDGSSGVLAYDITGIESNIANDLGGSGSPESYFNNTILQSSAPVSKYAGGSTIYTSTNAAQETCLFCHYVNGYDGIVDTNGVPTGSGSFTASGSIITDGGTVSAITPYAIDVSGYSCSAGYMLISNFCSQSVTVGGAGVTFGTIIDDTLIGSGGGFGSNNGPMNDGLSSVAAPGSVSAATGSATGEVNLGWTSTNSSSAQIATDFVVLESTASSGPFTPVGIVITADNATQSYGYAVGGLTSGTTYYFKVEALNNSTGLTATSSSVSAAAK